MDGGVTGLVGGDDTLVGLAGDDTLDAWSGDDLLSGGAGNDELQEREGEDTLIGGDGDDLIWGVDSPGRDVIRAGSGDDQVSGADRSDVAFGGAGSDSIAIFVEGSVIADLRSGTVTALDGSWTQTFRGFESLSVYSGTADTIELTGTAGANSLGAGFGRSTIFGLAGDDRIFGGNDNDLLMGGAGDDRIFAGLGNDICRGGAGDDTIDGYWDRDRLFGGEGADELTGGAQQDWFVFEDASHSAFGAGDSITDFLTGLDRINLAALGIDTFIGGAAFTAGDGVVEVRFDTAARQVQADINDDGVFGAGDLEINLLFDSTGVATGDLILT